MGAFPEPKPTRYGRYILLDRINVGGMAEVFRGKMAGVEGFERLVALKRILPNVAADPDFIEMFVDEAKLAVQLQHANIAQTFDLGKEEDTYYIAMEYVSGVDLRSMWDRARHRSRLLPIAMSCHVMQKVCEGLDAAHRKKDQAGVDISLVHRDVSPQNVLVSYEGEVKVIDFGIARAANKVSKTQAGVLKGKFGYMSPEQVRGMDLDNRSDIFACGVVLYELLVGDRLFLGESDFSTLEKVRNVEMVPPTRLNKNLSPQLERIVMKALAKSRDDRYRWASEMAEDLQRYLFATNQPFARTDLQRYMQQHFKEEMAKERARLDRFRAVTMADVEGAAPPPRGASVVSMPEPRTEVGGAAMPALAGRPGSVAVGPLGATPVMPSMPVAEEAFAAGGLSASMPALPADAGRARLPAWAAGVIGGLSVLLLGVGGVAVYLAVARPEPGIITVDVTPTAAEILLDDRLVANQSPFTLEVEPRTYVLTVRARDHEPVVRALSVGEGEHRMESVQLQRVKGSASLVIRTVPEGLQVWVDGADSGRVTPATVSGLFAGDHQIALKRPDGAVVHRFRMSLENGAAEAVEVDTSKLPPLLDVTSRPEGAQVKVGGVLKGTTPVTIAGLAEGAVEVVVERAGCKAETRRVDLARATVVPLEVRLECGGP